MAKDALSLVGQTIQNIRFDQIVDEGGFGYVYRGHHLGLNEPVAIKCLKVRGGNDELGSFESRFRDETKIAYRLSQGSLDIVRSISSGTLTTALGMVVPYMVLEWLDGRTLSVEMTARKNNGLPPFTFEETLSWMESAARALAHAHAEGVIHRDVKPSNLFVAETRDGKRVKVLDFGLAKILDPDTFMKPEAQPTASHVFVCSPAYGAPEQFSRELGALSTATDVYSFAFVLLEMMSGKKVREVGSIMEGMLRAIDPRFASPSPASLGVGLRGPVERVFIKAVAIDPKERWADVGAFWNALVEASRAAEHSGPTLVDKVPAGAMDALDEARRRAEAFRLVGQGGKGGTLGMAPVKGQPEVAPDQTLAMAFAPKRPDPSEPSVPNQQGNVQVRTLPLDATSPAVPELADPVTHPPRAQYPSLPPAAPPMQSSLMPWLVAVVVFVLAAAGTLAFLGRKR
jgi:serine/threonine-protein kinase